MSDKKNRSHQSLDGFKTVGRLDGFINNSPKVYNVRTKNPDNGVNITEEKLQPKPAGDQGFIGTYTYSAAENQADHKRGKVLRHRDTSSLKSARPRSRRLSLPRISPFKFFKRLTFAVILLGLIGAGWLGVQGLLTIRKVFNDDGSTAIALGRKVDPGQLSTEGDGRVNILLLGKGGANHPGGELTDSIMIASIDPFAESAALLSLPRDLYVEAPDLYDMKINSVYISAKDAALGEGLSEAEAETKGLETLKQVVTKSIGVPIHYHVVVDFTAFQEAVDAVGGVEINITEPLYDANFAPDVLDVDVGLQQFDGKRALYYSRSRVTSKRGDFDRGERQRQVLLALKAKILSAGTFSNPVKISQLMSTLGNNVQTNVSFDELRQLYDLAAKIDDSQIKSLELAGDPVLVQTSRVGNQSVVIPVAGRSDFSEIRAYVRSQLKDGFINQENATVTVLNGSTTSGLATAKANELKSFGYNVVEVADAPVKGYIDSMIIRLNDDKPYTNRYLEKRFNLATTKDLPAGFEQYLTDFVIIVGANEEISD